jgi:biopolymer transport protein ExbD
LARRRREFDEGGLTMTPLIDVVLLLLIFYVVTTAFQDREIELKLPESDSSAIPEEKKKFVIEIGRGPGDLAMNGERITVEGIDAMIAAEASADNIQSVEIKADEYVYHRRVIEVLGIVKKHGVDAVGIAVREKR